MIKKMQSLVFFSVFIVTVTQALQRNETGVLWVRLNSCNTWGWSSEPNQPALMFIALHGTPACLQTIQCCSGEQNTSWLDCLLASHKLQEAGLQADFQKPNADVSSTLFYFAICIWLLESPTRTTQSRFVPWTIACRFTHWQAWLKLRNKLWLTFWKPFC